MSVENDGALLLFISRWLGYYNRLFKLRLAGWIVSSFMLMDDWIHTVESFEINKIFLRFTDLTIVITIVLSGLKFLEC